MITFGIQKLITTINMKIISCNRIKKILLLNLFLFHLSGIVFASDTNGNNDIISKYKNLSKQQLLATGDSLYYENTYDEALVCFSLVINTSNKETDIEEQKKVIEALNKSAIIYRHMSDYQMALKLLLKGLDLCEKYHDDEYISKLYANIGDIYYYFKKYDTSKSYALKALESCQDSAIMVIILNNLGILELERGNNEDALGYLNQSLKISKQQNDTYLHGILNSIALFYQETHQCDSAFYYFRLSLDETKKKYKNKAEAEIEAQNLSELSKLFLETNQKDSALFYIDLSNNVAIENNFWEILAENYFTLSKIEEKGGSNQNALEYYKKYVNLKDSIFNVDRFGEINQAQRLYEISKTNQQIEQLSIEQQIKERTIRYQKIIQFITLFILLLVCAVLLVVFFQKKKLNRAYKALFEKNIEIVKLQKESSSEKDLEKYPNSALTDEKQLELMDEILTIMKDISIICDPKFSLNKLAEILHSNHAYVSQVINTAKNKNFRSFLNSYRIREAQRIFSEPNAKKYTIESIALQVGFKSQSSFRNAFKEITGVSPNFYLKSMQAQYNQ